jgi:hypothetical protein
MSPVPILLVTLRYAVQWYRIAVLTGFEGNRGNAGLGVFVRLDQVTRWRRAKTASATFFNCVYDVNDCPAIEVHERVVWYSCHFERKAA